MKFIPNVCDKSGKTVAMDFGGGSGIFTRMMRDYGFDFYHYNKYAKNEFARGFEADMNEKYALVTIFETFEHYANPLEEINTLFNMTNILFFSTHLIASNPPLVKDWEYYNPSAGQHISFYSLKTLKFIAKRYECQLLSNDNTLHILSKIPIRKDFFRLLCLYDKIRNRLNITKRFRKKSKTNSDSEMMILRLSEQGGNIYI